MNKKELSERDICTKFITPAVVEAGWDIRRQVREELTFTSGRIHVKGNSAARGTPKRADYVLYHKPHIPIAIIEAKDNNHSIRSGIQQAIDYAEILDVPFAYSSNGDGFIQHDRTVEHGEIERELKLTEFPSPSELWDRYSKWKGITKNEEPVVTQDYYFDISGKKPWYFQETAINRTIEAVANGQRRILLVMATGTGKTYTSFQIIWRLWKAGVVKRVLFLADRNILVDQTMTNDFKHFGQEMTKVTKRTVDKSYEIYLALYQAITGVEEEKKIYKKFSPGFFDLIVVDECHRGSAAEDAEWHEILKYFKDSIQIGLTATPKETKYISNISYFGDPLYIYSLKQGIEDGFLAPYKVVRIMIDKDLEGWRPPKGMLDKYGKEIEDRIYNLKDYDRTLVIDDRTQLVANRISEFLKSNNRFSKTIVFCEDIDHAERMRHALINENADLVAENSKYVLKITGDDEIGKQELDNFINPEEKYPVIATTSKLMSTGVDSQTCEVIVLDKNINSMTEFKQIIGRGTRIREDFNKMFFTIIDFRNATRLFFDPEFDGEPVEVYDPDTGTTYAPGEPKEGDDKGEEILREPVEKVQYYDKERGLVTMSLRDFTKQNILNMYSSLDSFLTTWNQVDRKQAIISELVEHGVFIDELKSKVGKDLDPFDLICHVAFDMPPLTRSERANNVKKRNYFAEYGDIGKKVLESLLDKYSDQGVEAIEDALERDNIVDFLRVPPFNEIGTPIQIIDKFGGKQKYLKALKELEEEIYKAA
jgi:type I restriction enzyme R subunit